MKPVAKLSTIWVQFFFLIHANFANYYNTKIVYFSESWSYVNALNFVLFGDYSKL